MTVSVLPAPQLTVSPSVHQVVVQTTPAPQVLVTEDGVTVVALGIQGPPGAAGPSGAAAAPVNFAFGDASPAVVSSGQPAQVILQINVNITIPFNGAGAKLSIGTVTSTSLYVASSQLDLSVATEFEITVGKAIAANTDIVATIMPGAGATAGAGWILVERVSS